MKPFLKAPPRQAQRPKVRTEDIQAAVQLHRGGKIDEARSAYRRILELAPGQPDILHFQGLLKYQTLGGDAGVPDVRRALEAAPDYADAHANLAIMLLEMGDYDGAIRHLDRAMLLAPQALSPQITRARVYRRQGRAADAEAVLREAIDQHPQGFDRQIGPVIHYTLGNAVVAQGRAAEALVEYDRGLAIDPDHALLRAMRGRSLCLLGRFDEAADNFRQMLARNPDDATARHLLAACGGSDAPQRAGDDYVRETFDAFANSFDSKLASLGYRAPQLIADLLKSCVGDAPATPELELADAGCGTGLLAELVRPWCRRLVGVDLSTGMLARARARNLYDALDAAELTAWLDARPAGFDAVAIADTLCYFGDLESALKAAHTALCASGWLLFTVEHGAHDAPSLLQTHGRYSHRRSYVEAALSATGFRNVRIQEDVLRMERRLPVNGLIVAARK